ncbi:L-serine ammonia-lyase, iron-sulfur-dependent subunit beta [Paenibacillus sp. MWE-103]|uniref:L-serine deaminase n=1 Tax=Paenibacillus artemisiicola TaxID=1172618 RepID=A0ABS3WC98_9BACL|nr:L-serine ammonia-lyase, iron-sulfur-dependent subunit beta [Paenibacillus artemisiicola]MBO7745917.1 L-serine ammonia-lyase, iron-sulfur-dependent subunit beta [Paenibacillus artemisiicola]
MRFKDVFAIIGPVMVGPSSSHTAGAARLGRAARQLLGDVPERAVVTLYGSFAETFAGHGTDLAIVGGLLDFAADDGRIPSAFAEAEQAGMGVTIRRGAGTKPHPNYAEIEAARGVRTVSVGGASVGGGTIEIHEINGFKAGCSGHYPAIAVTHADRVGVLAAIAQAIGGAGLNIGYLQTGRQGRGGAALTVAECDRMPDEALLAAIASLPHVAEAAVIHLN